MFSNSLNDSFSGCIYSDLSDHLLIFGTIEFCKTYFPPTQCYYRHINEHNINVFKERLTSAVFQIPHENSLYKFNETFNNLTESCFPISKLSKRKSPRQSWISKGILVSINTKNKLFKKYKQTNNESSERTFKMFRNKLEHVKRLAKKLYFTSEINKYK